MLRARHPRRLPTAGGGPGACRGKEWEGDAPAGWAPAPPAAGAERVGATREAPDTRSVREARTRRAPASLPVAGAAGAAASGGRRRRGRGGEEARRGRGEGCWEQQRGWGQQVASRRAAAAEGGALRRPALVSTPAQGGGRFFFLRLLRRRLLCHQWALSRSLGGSVLLLQRQQESANQSCNANMKSVATIVRALRSCCSNTTTTANSFERSASSDTLCSSIRFSLSIQQTPPTENQQRRN